MSSTLSHLECSKCSARRSADVAQHLCDCGGPLLARYDLGRARMLLTASVLAQRPSDLWRFRELMPLRDPQHAISLGERTTPIIGLPDGSLLKDEGLLPTGSFKARGAAVGVARAHELDVRDVALPTNGNAGVAWAAYAARFGMRAHLAIPKAAPPPYARMCEDFNAHVELVDGTIADAGRVVAGWIAEHGYYDASTLKEPYRIEGKKTLGFEIAEQFEWHLPDVIVYPTGGGVGLIGMHKAFQELQALGFLPRRMPRFVAVQSAGCAPLARAWQAKATESTFWPDAHTYAYGINVPKAIGDFIVLKILAETDGTAIAIADADIEAARRRIASHGVLTCPEGAATVAAVDSLRASGWIRERERVLVVNTGSPLASYV